MKRLVREQLDQLIIEGKLLAFEISKRLGITEMDVQRRKERLRKKGIVIPKEDWAKAAEKRKEHYATQYTPEE